MVFINIDINLYKKMRKTNLIISSLAFITLTACTETKQTETNQSEKTEMEKAEFFVTPGYGERQLKMHGYSQAVKIGNRIETSGQGGWDADGNWEFPKDLKDEIAQAFDNVTRTLETAGATWDNVVAIHSYHVGFQEEVNEMMTENFRKHMPNHAPIWTLLGVEKLGDPKMRVEIRVVAVI